MNFPCELLTTECWSLWRPQIDKGIPQFTQPNLPWIKTHSLSWSKELLKNIILNSISLYNIIIITVTPIQSQTSPRLWYVVVVNRTFESSEEPRFNIIVVNAMQQSVTAGAMGEVGKFSTTLRLHVRSNEYCFQIVHYVSNLVHPLCIILFWV